MQRDLVDPTQFPDPDCDQISVSAEKIIISQSDSYHVHVLNSPVDGLSYSL